LVTGRDILKLTPKTRAEIISYTGGKLPLLDVSAAVILTH